MWLSENGYCSRCPSCGGSLTCKMSKCSSPERKIMQKFPNCCKTCDPVSGVALRPTQVERHLDLGHELSYEPALDVGPLNLRNPIRAPENGMQLVAVTHGQGKDSFLSVVLFYSPAEVDPGSGEKYVTWIYNHEVNGAAEGHYHHRFGHPEDLEQVAWADFVERSRQYALHAGRWNDWERQIRTRMGAEKLVIK